MGIWLYTKKASFDCSYTYWNELRIHILNATFKYVKDKIKKDSEKYGHLTEYDEQWIGEGSRYSCHMNDFNELNKILYQGSPTIMFNSSTLNLFVSLIQSLKYREAINYFDIGGIISFCLKCDCDGYYTPGNSLDICCLLDRIKPYVNNEFRNFYDAVYGDNQLEQTSLYDLFEDSYKTLCKVIIS